MELLPLEPSLMQSVSPVAWVHNDLKREWLCVIDDELSNCCRRHFDSFADSRGVAYSCFLRLLVSLGTRVSCAHKKKFFWCEHVDRSYRPHSLHEDAVSPLSKNARHYSFTSSGWVYCLHFGCIGRQVYWLHFAWSRWKVYCRAFLREQA